MPPRRGVLGSSLAANGLLSSFHLPGRSKVEIFAGLKLSPLSFSLFSLSQEAFEMLISLCTLTTKVPLVPLIKAAAAISTLISQFVAHTSFLWRHRSFLKLSILNLMLTQLILSRTGNQDLLGSKSSHLLSSLMSYHLAFFMPRLASRIETIP